MPYIIIALLVVVILITIGLRGKAKYYQKIYSDEHYRQIGEWVIRVLRLGPVERPAIEDGTALLTEAAVVMAFTCEMDNDHDTIHFSISQQQGYTTHAVGNRIIFFLVQLLNENKSRGDWFYTKSTVHHFVLQKEKAQEWSVIPVDEAIARTKNYSALPIEQRDEL